MDKMTIFSLRQADLKAQLCDELSAAGYAPINQKGFLYAAGTIPVLLVAHLDTVHAEPPKRVRKLYNGDVWQAENGIGGDDRCGVYALLEIIRTHKVHVLFCEDEEFGGIGAELFVCSGIAPDVNFIIEFDRRGRDDAVFYDCENLEFKDFVCSYGFYENFGSFSDISILAPELGVAAANLSSGYYYEHTTMECVVWSQLHDNIEKVRRLLDGELKYYEYMSGTLWDDLKTDFDW